ncbi:MAG: hypothetical protein IPO92_05875 [Saprospiraceae bacterium]|nr:hypothetical protein [Saprospiraceae bacterium]
MCKLFIKRLTLVFILTLFTFCGFSQLFYTYNFSGDQANLIINDCNHLEPSLGCLPNLVNITPVMMEFADTEGSNCNVNNATNNSGMCPAEPVLTMPPYYPFEGGDNDCMYETVAVDITNRCNVVMTVNYSVVNFSTIPSANNLDCAPGNGQDRLVFEYSLTNGVSWLPVNAAQPNVICPPANGNLSGMTYSFSSPAFNGTNVKFRMTFGIQSVTEGVRINSVTLTAAVAPSANFNFADFCIGSPNGPTSILTSGGTFSLNPNPGGGVSINPVTGIITGAVAGTTYTIQYNTPGPCPNIHTEDVLVNALQNATFLLLIFV